MISISTYSTEHVHKPRRTRNVVRCNLCNQDYKPAFSYQRFCKHCRTSVLPRLSSPEFDVMSEVFSLSKLEAA